MKYAPKSSVHCTCRTGKINKFDYFETGFRTFVVLKTKNHPPILSGFVWFCLKLANPPPYLPDILYGGPIPIATGQGLRNSPWVGCIEILKTRILRRVRTDRFQVLDKRDTIKQAQANISFNKNQNIRTIISLIQILIKLRMNKWLAIVQYLFLISMFSCYLDCFYHLFQNKTCHNTNHNFLLNCCDHDS